MKEKLINFYMRYKLFIYPTVVTICGAVLIVFVILPQLMGFLDSRTAYESIISKEKVLEVKAQELLSLNEAEVKSDMDVVLEVLPVGKDYPKVIGMVQRLSAKYLFNLASLQFSDSIAKEVANKQTTPTYMVKMDLVGSKESLKFFINELESTIPISKVEVIEVTSTPEDSNVNVSITFNVYYSDIPKSLGSVETPLVHISSDEKALISKYSPLVRNNRSSTEPVSAKGKLNPFE